MNYKIVKHVLTKPLQILYIDFHRFRIRFGRLRFRRFSIGFGRFKRLEQTLQTRVTIILDLCLYVLIFCFRRFGLSFGRLI